MEGGRMFSRARPALLVCLLVGDSALAEAVRLREPFPVGHEVHVQVRVELSGAMTIPEEKGKPGKTVKINGSSNIAYDERVLSEKAGEVTKTARVYAKLDFQRALAGQDQKMT